MAFNNHNLGDFTVLNGVMVKIGDKLKPPLRVTLPVDWQPVCADDHLSINYDFHCEEEAMRFAEEEERIRDLQVKEEAAKEYERLIAEQAAARKEEDIKDEDDENNDVEGGEYIDLVEQTILTPQVVASVKKPDDNNVAKDSKPQQKEIDLNEFEAQSDNPFEQVERQTLNVLDELQSVLDPKSAKKKKGKRREQKLSESENDEFNLNLFNSVEQNDSLQNNNNTILDLNPSKSDFNVPGNVTILDLNPSKSDFNVPDNVSRGTLRWTSFDNDALKSPIQNSQINNMPSSTIDTFKQNNRLTEATTGIFQMNLNPVLPPIPCSNESNFSCENREQKLTRTTSMPNLADDDIEVVNSQPELSRNKSNENISVDPNQLGNIDTNRINSIMQQFQFQRLSDAPLPPAHDSYNKPMFSDTNPFKEGCSTVPNIPSYTSPVSSSNLNATTPLQNISQMAPLSQFNSPAINTMVAPTSQYNNVAAQMYPSNLMPYSTASVALPSNSSAGIATSNGIIIPPPIVPRPQAASRITPIVPPPNSKTPPPIPAHRKRSSHSPQQEVLLPQDTSYAAAKPQTVGHNLNQFPATKEVSTTKQASWLKDETAFLPTAEKKFSIQISAMGFPLPVVSRTVKRLGQSQKEVIDFLCLFEGTKEKYSNYKPDDVETALINSPQQCDQYLQLVSTFRELGFACADIHDALKQEESFDQDKLLDRLTR